MPIQNRDTLLGLAKNERDHENLSLLIEIVESGLKYAQPENLLSAKISMVSNDIIIEEHRYSLSAFKRRYLIAFGKAAVSMTKWFLEHLLMPFDEVVIASVGVEETSFDSNITCFKCGHPHPNVDSVKAASYVLNLLSSLSENDLCIMLISGGGSAILEKPAYEISLEDYNLLIEKLLLCGANIHEINTIRKHFSAVKGGKLAISTKAKILSFIISDVIGDCISVIASGPTAPDKTTWSDVDFLFKKYNLYPVLPEVFADTIEKGLKGIIEDTPSEKENFKHVNNYLVGSNKQLITYLKNYLLSGHFEVKTINYPIKGEAKTVGEKIAQNIRNRFSVMSKSITKKPFFFLSGGETTVTITETSKAGFGGRNQELALAFAISSKNLECFFVSLGTDGIDGNSKAAGALVTPYTLESLDAQKDAEICIKNHDSNSFFKKYGGEIITGLTGTNLMDVIVCLIPKCD